MTKTVKISVARQVELQPIDLPDSIFQHPEIPGLSGINLPLESLGQQAADAVIEDFIRRFYDKAQLTNPWHRKVYR
jgi:hypothetical protein